jgi:hypothetical protein
LGCQWFLQVNPVKLLIKTIQYTVESSHSFDCMTA